MTIDGATKKRPGRRWAYACAQLGGAVSIAANWAHSYVPPNHARAGWAPEPGAVAFSVFWPIAVLFAVEAFARAPWPTGRRYALIRFGGLLPVAVVAAVVSYLHLSGLLRHYDAGLFEANFGPLVIDGLMLIGTGALIVTSRPQATAATTVEPTPTPVVEVAGLSAMPAADPPTDVATELPAPVATPADTKRPATRKTAPAKASAKRPAKTATKASKPAVEDRNDDQLVAIIRPLVVGTSELPSQYKLYNAIKAETGRGAGYPKIAELVERAQREAQQRPATAEPAKTNGHAVSDLIPTGGTS